MYAGHDFSIIHAVWCASGGHLLRVGWLHSVIAMFVEPHENGEVKFDPANDQNYIHTVAEISTGKIIDDVWKMLWKVAWTSRQQDFAQKRSNALLCKNVSVIDILFNFARFAGVPQKGTGNWSIVEIGHVEFTSNTYSKTTKLGFSSLRTPHQALRIQQIVMQTISLEQRTCVRYTYLKCGRAETISFQDSITRLQWRLQSNLPRFPCSEGMLGWFERSCMDQPLPVPEFLLVFMPGIQPIHLTLESWCMS